MRDAAHRHVQIDGIARGAPGLAADAQVEGGADARIDAELHRHRIPVVAACDIGDAALEQPAQDEGGIAGRAAARIVGGVRDHHRPAGQRQRRIERGVDRQEGR